MLFSIDPEIPRLLKGMYLMCGVFTDRFEIDGHAEWNARLDPQATDIVYRARPPIHRSVGLDVTLQTILPDEDIRQKFTVPLLRPVLDFAEVWFQHTSQLVFHDPLAATTIFDDQICSFQRGTVRTDTNLEPGRTLWRADGDGSHEVALEVNVARFYQHYFSTFQAA
jgi:inosine-uridine nucleoside N-ribohydrolase